MTGIAMLLKSKWGIDLEKIQAVIAALDPATVQQILTSAQAAVPLVLEFIERMDKRLESIEARLSKLERIFAIDETTARQEVNHERGTRSLAAAGSAGASGGTHRRTA